MSVQFATDKTIKNYVSSSNVLIAATILALIVVNLPFTRDIYDSLWNHEIALQVGGFNLFSHHGEPMSIMAFINDALMALFFFSVGLEIKREVLVGELSSFRNALLPILGAIGGMAIPVLFYFLMARGTDYAGGAAIPMATDIAFSLGVLTFLGSRVPVGLKVFLTTLAVVDDIGGIIVIALFYSASIDTTLLLYAAIILLALWTGGKLGMQSKLFYIFLGAFVWFFFLNAGIHPTIAGVLVAFCVPAKPVFAPVRYVRTIRRNIGYFAHDKDDSLVSRTILSKDQRRNLFRRHVLKPAFPRYSAGNHDCPYTGQVYRYILLLGHRHTVEMGADAQRRFMDEPRLRSSARRNRIHRLPLHSRPFFRRLHPTHLGSAQRCQIRNSCRLGNSRSVRLGIPSPDPAQKDKRGRQSATLTDRANI